MGNCWSLPSGSAGAHPNSSTAGNNQIGSSQFSAGPSNTQNDNSTSLERSSYSGGIGRLSGPSSSNYTTSNNTSTSLWGSENSQNTGLRGEVFPNGQILDAANLRVFTLVELRAATSNFKADSRIGEGGFGTVYKGWIKERAATNRGERLTIAVKKLNSYSMQGVAEWQTEVNFLGRLSHPNLIKLLGFGQEDSQLFLVYEYMQRGSLENHLFGRGANVRPLSWDTRLKVMIEVARALAFLHSLENKIIHRDLKSSNILLDKTYTAKLSDFGLARYGPSTDQTHVTTRVMGTFGYAAPEYIATGHLYVKTDVYAFGILLMEMLTGKPVSDILRPIKQVSLLDWFKSNILNRRKMRNTMDARLEGKYPPNLALQVAQLTFKCIQANHKVRPSMQEVVETLEQVEAANEKPADNRKHATHSRVVQRHGRPDEG